MAWVKHEQTHPANRATAVYSEVEDNDASKSLDVTTDLGAAYSIRVRHVEVKYTCTATVGTRTPRIAVVRDGEVTTLMTFDTGVVLTAGLSARIFFVAGQISPFETVAGSTNHFHSLPPLVLTQGDVLTINDTSSVDAAADDMHIFIHADVLSGV